MYGLSHNSFYENDASQPMYSEIINQFKRGSNPETGHYCCVYVGVLISLWLFLFAPQPKEFFLDGLKKLQQRSHKCVELRGEYVE
jgi:hypothetical protein